MPAASPEKPTPVIANAYQLEHIEKAGAPNGCTGKDWFRYTITQGVNKITGYKQGSQRAVTKSVKEIVLELNERRAGKKGRVHLTPSRKRQQANAARQAAARK
ncbi:MAG: hypothetical protein E2O52_01210 [Gammaproteobacteria bacterium]|nr:MAG: hypothetical protein E2O52_01210 [Gammaproteobacteria bacterium]